MKLERTRAQRKPQIRTDGRPGRRGSRGGHAYQRLRDAPRHRAKPALAEHEELAKAVQKRDADLAESVARRHLRSAQAERMRNLFPYPDRRQAEPS